MDVKQPWGQGREKSSSLKKGGEFLKVEARAGERCIHE